MNSEAVGVVLLIGLGVGLIIFGQTAVEKPGTYLIIEDSVNESALPPDANVVTYTNLSDRSQEKFQRAVEEEEKVYLGSGPPSDFPEQGYVLYQGSYYPIGYEFNDMATDPSLMFTIFGGFITAVSVLLGAYVLGKQSLE